MSELVPLNIAIAEPPSEEYVRKTAGLMAAEYHDAVGKIRVAMNEITRQTERLQEAFRFESADKPMWEREFGPSRNSYDFGIGFTYHGVSCTNDNEKIFEGFKREAWKIIANRLGIKTAMSIKAREEFEKQLSDGDLPEIDENAILNMIFGLVDRAKEFAANAAKEVFEILRPHRGDYKTNDVFKIGKRVILAYYCERQWNGKKFRINYSRDKYVTAIDGLFRLLDGKTPLQNGRGELIEAVSNSPDGRGETEYFKFKCFKNQNLHLEFKRLDLVKQINLLGMGEYVLDETDDVRVGETAIVPKGSAA